MKLLKLSNTNTKVTTNPY